MRRQETSLWLRRTTRARILAALPSLEVRPVPLREARTASGVVLTNALRGVRPALSWDGRDLPGSTDLKARLDPGLSQMEEPDSLA